MAINTSPPNSSNAILPTAFLATMQAIPKLKQQLATDCQGERQQNGEKKD